jgi:hypothetical protein
MAYEFWEWDEELQPQASSARSGGPPRKSTRIGVLDPPRPPRSPRGPSAAPLASFLMRLFAGLVLAGLALFGLYLLFGGQR